MNKPLNHIAIILIFSSIAAWAMEQQEQQQAPPNPSPSSASSSSSSSSSSAPKKSILKKTPHEGQKKKLQFTADTQDTSKPATRSEAERVTQYREEQAEIEKEQEAISGQGAPASEEEALQRLISFAQTTIPEVEQIIDDCANDIVAIWNFFCIVPTSPQMATENFAKLGVAIKDYEKNLVPITNRFTGQVADSVVEGYGKMLDNLKHQAIYQWNSNQEVEKLDDLLSNYMEPIFEKASTLYAQTKKAELDKMFSQIKPEATAQEQYNQAVSLGHAFLDNSSEIENKVDAFMKKNKIKGYSKHDYLAQLYSKAKTEKKIIIEGVWPYAQKVGQTKESLMYVL